LHITAYFDKVQNVLDIEVNSFKKNV